MKHNFKKIISILLVVVMCLGAFPVGIFAEGEGHEHAETNAVVCDVCGTSDKVSKETEVPTATCTDAAGAWYVCTKTDKHEGNVDNHFFVQTAPALHNVEGNLELKSEGEDATCTTPGTIAYWLCKVEGGCGKYLKKVDGKYVAIEIAEGKTIADYVTINADDTIPTYSATASDAENNGLHSFGAWNKVQDKICGVQNGIEERTCTECQGVQQRFDSKDAHDWEVDFSELENIDCNSTHVVTATCKDCGTTEDRLAYGWKHERVVVEYSSAADCVNAGNVAYFSCIHCGDYFVIRDSKYVEVEENEWVIPALGHIWDREGAAADLGKTAAVPATCETSGNYEYWTCTDCSKVFTSKAATAEYTENDEHVWGWFIPATNHNYELVPESDSTCTSVGTESYYRCTNSGCTDKFKRSGDAEPYTYTKLTAPEVEALVIAKKAHVFGTFSPATTKNCTEGVVGTYAYATCATCSQKFAVAVSDDPGTVGVDESHGGHALDVTFEAQDVADFNGTDESKKNLATIKLNAFLNDADTIIVTDVAQYFEWPSATNPAETEWVAVAPEGHANMAHNWERVGAYVAPTCYRNGYAFWVCQDCDLYTTDATNYATYYEKLNHAGIENNITDAVVPNCKDVGNRAYAKCPICSDCFEVVDGVIDFSTARAESDPYLTNLPKNDLNHKTPEVKGTEVKAPTCTESGLRAYSYCGACGKYFTGTNNTDAVENYDTEAAAKTDPKHPQTEHAKVMPTCVADGNVNYWSCSCGKYFADAACTTELTADEVKYTLAEALAAEDAGLVNNGHTIQFVDIDPAKCYKDGIAAHYKCTAEGCGKLFSDANGATETTDAALKIDKSTVAHSYTEVQAPVACKPDGTTLGAPGIEKCSVAECGHERVKTQHNFIIKVEDVAPSCKTKGKWHLECETCGSIEIENGEKVVYEYDEYRSHVEMGTTFHGQVDATTCTETGTKAYYQCNVCAKKFSDIACTVEVMDADLVIAAKHLDTESILADAPLTVCTPAGVDLKVAQTHCKKCGKYYEADGVEKDAVITVKTYHTVTLTPKYTATDFENSQATCLDEGYTQIYNCSACSKWFTTVEGATETTEASAVTGPLGHVGTEVIGQVDPTCIATGRHAYVVCTRCDERIPVKEVTGESGTELVINAEAAPYTDVTIVIPKVNHVTEYVKPIAPVCGIDEEGNYTVIPGVIGYYECTVDGCGAKFATENPAHDATAYKPEELVNAVHSFTKVSAKTVTVDPDCVNWGYTQYTCKCGEVKYEFIAPVYHDTTANNNPEYVAPECSTPGMLVYYYCVNCNKSYADADCTEVLYKTAPTKDDLSDAVYYTCDADAVVPATGVHKNAAGVILTTNCMKVVGGNNVPDLDNIRATDRICAEGCGAEINIANHEVGSATLKDGSSAANCTHAASTYKICTVCNEIVPGTQDYEGEIDPSKHVTKIGTEDNWFIHTPASCITKGEKQLKCVLCDALVGDVVPVAATAAHTFTSDPSDPASIPDEYVKPTCTSEGVKTWHCTLNCGLEGSTVKVTVDKLAFDGHNTEGVDWTIDYSKDHNDPKGQYKICKNAGCNVPDPATYTYRDDVEFSAEIENAIVKDAVLVNSGRIAVTISLAAHNKNVKLLTYKFNASANLSIVRDDEGNVVFDNRTNIPTENITVGTDAFDPTLVTVVAYTYFEALVVDATPSEFITVYFDIDESAVVSDVVITPASAEASTTDASFETVDYVTTKGDVVDSEVSVLGDYKVTMNEDGTITFNDGDGIIGATSELQALITIYCEDYNATYYDSRLDFNKDKRIGLEDLNALLKYTAGGTYAELIKSAS